MSDRQINSSMKPGRMPRCAHRRAACRVMGIMLSSVVMLKALVHPAISVVHKMGIFVTDFVNIFSRFLITMDLLRIREKGICGSVIADMHEPARAGLSRVVA